MCLCVCVCLCDLIFIAFWHNEAVCCGETDVWGVGFGLLEWGLWCGATENKCKRHLIEIDEERWKRLLHRQIYIKKRLNQEHQEATIYHVSIIHRYILISGEKNGSDIDAFSTKKKAPNEKNKQKYSSTLLHPPQCLTCAKTEKYLFRGQNATREITWSFIVQLFIEWRHFHSKTHLDTSPLFAGLQ